MHWAAIQKTACPHLQVCTQMSGMGSESCTYHWLWWCPHQKPQSTDASPKLPLKDDPLLFFSQFLFYILKTEGWSVQNAFLAYYSAYNCCHSTSFQNRKYSLMNNLKTLNSKKGIFKGTASFEWRLQEKIKHLKTMNRISSQAKQPNGLNSSVYDLHSSIWNDSIQYLPFQTCRVYRRTQSFFSWFFAFTLLNNMKKIFVI